MATIRKMWACKNTHCKNEKGKHRGYKKVCLGEKKPPLCKWCLQPMTLGGSLVARIQIDGQTSTKTVSSNKKDAESYLYACKEAARTGRLLPGEEPLITWTEAAREFTEWVERSVANKGLSKNTATVYVSTLKVLTKTFSRKKLQDFERSDVEQFKEDRLEEVGKGAVNLALSTLNRVFSIVCDARSAKKYPILHEAQIEVRKAKQYPLDNIRDNILETQEEIQTLLRFAAEGKPHLFHFAFGILNTGLRHSDMLKLRLSEISFERNDIRTTVKGRASKGGKKVIIPLTPQYRAYLEKWITDLKARKVRSINDYLIPSTSDPNKCFNFTSDIGFDTLKEKCAKHFEKQGRYDVAARFRKLVPHDLRHTFATHWLYAHPESNAIHMLGIILGHSDHYITERYGHAVQHLQQQAMAGFGNYLSESLNIGNGFGISGELPRNTVPPKGVGKPKG